MNFDLNTRAALYRLAAAVGALLVSYGLLSETELAAWLEVVGAMIAIGGSLLAAANTPRPTRKHPPKPSTDTDGWVDYPGYISPPTDTGPAYLGDDTPTEQYGNGWRES